MRITQIILKFKRDIIKYTLQNFPSGPLRPQQRYTIVYEFIFGIDFGTQKI